MITCVGKKNGKYQIKESIPGLRLVFTSECKADFEQVAAPKRATKSVKFSLTVDYLRENWPGFLPL